MNDIYSITTPIYYVNDEPHLGHAYTTILADVLARYARLDGRPAFFLTGTDEHGQKVQAAAQRNGMEPRSYVDIMVTRFQAAWEHLSIRPDDFIRTTEPRHVQVVQQVLQDLWQRGEIYRGDYSGWYCLPDERFWTEKDLKEGLCPDCGRPVEQVVEPAYFFRMGRQQSWLVEYIQQHPDFIQPPYRGNEVLGFLRQPLGDLCISRPVSRLAWGIPLPFDPQYVTYVWFDALLNYITAAGYLSDPARFAGQWPHTIHLIGKDILTTHSVYWPTMLHAAGLPMPRTIFAHGWWVMEGLKISKSRGNTVKPLELAGIYGVDAFRFFLMREMALGQDADFNEERLSTRYQTDLVNNLGNLVHRLVNMAGRYCGSRVPEPGVPIPEDLALRARCEALPGRTFALLENFSVHLALEEIMTALGEVNQYLERQAPWKLAAQGQGARAGGVLYTALEALRLVSVLLSPVIPAQAPEIWRRLGWQPGSGEPSPADLVWGGLLPGAEVIPGTPLFPREV